MTRVALVALCLISTLPLLAQDMSVRRYTAPTLLSLRPDGTQLFRDATGPRAAVGSEKADTAFIFAVVGRAAGAGGTFFRSEVTLVNNLTRVQNLAVYYFPSGGGSCAGASVQTLRFDPFSYFAWTDFVGDIFNTTGLGSVVVFAVDSAGNFDGNASIDGFSRIWTPVPGFQGTASQSFPSVALSGNPNAQFIYGVRQDPSFRTNVFIFNYLPTGSTAPRVFQGTIIGTTGNSSFTLSVPPCSLGVQSLSGTLGSLSMSITPPDSSGGWFAFGSTVDNASGDNWSVPARPSTK